MIGNKATENIAGEQLFVQLLNIIKNTNTKTPNAVSTLIKNPPLIYLVTRLW